MAGPFVVVIVADTGGQQQQQHINICDNRIKAKSNEWETAVNLNLSKYKLPKIFTRGHLSSKSISGVDEKCLHLNIGWVHVRWLESKPIRRVGGNLKFFHAIEFLIHSSHGWPIMSHACPISRTSHGDYIPSALPVSKK